MKLNRIILPLMACALTWSSCDDQIMEWKKLRRKYHSLRHSPCIKGKDSKL